MGAGRTPEESYRHCNGGPLVKGLRLRLAAVVGRVVSRSQRTNSLVLAAEAIILLPAEADGRRLGYQGLGYGAMPADIVEGRQAQDIAAFVSAIVGPLSRSAALLREPAWSGLVAG